MKKIVLISLAMISVGGLFLAGCAQPARAPSPFPSLSPAPASEEIIKLKFSNYQPPQSVPMLRFHEPFARKVEELTNGRIRITSYPGGVLGTAADQYDLVLTGTADMAMVSTGFLPGVFPLTEVIELPMQFGSSEVAGAVYWDITAKYLLDSDYRKVKVLYVNPTGLFNIFSTKEVKTLEDLKGLKTASPSPIEAKTFALLGLATASMPPPEMYIALKKGLIDLSWNEWEGGYVTWKTYEVTKYRIGNIDIATHPNVFIMNCDVWNSLPADIKHAFEEAGGFRKSRECGRIMDEVNEQALQQIVDYDQKIGNPPICYLPEDEKAKWKEAVTPQIEEWVAEKEAAGLPGRAILQDLQALVKKYSN